MIVGGKDYTGYNNIEKLLNKGTEGIIGDAINKGANAVANFSNRKLGTSANSGGRVHEGNLELTAKDFSSKGAGTLDVVKGDVTFHVSTVLDVPDVIKYIEGKLILIMDEMTEDYASINDVLPMVTCDALVVKSIKKLSYGELAEGETQVWAAYISKDSHIKVKKHITIDAAYVNMEHISGLNVKIKNGGGLNAYENVFLNTVLVGPGSVVNVIGGKNVNISTLYLNGGLIKGAKNSRPATIKFEH